MTKTYAQGTQDFAEQGSHVFVYLLYLRSLTGIFVTFLSHLPLPTARLFSFDLYKPKLKVFDSALLYLMPWVLTVRFSSYL